MNAGLMKFEPMHEGYGLPVVAGANYTLVGSWHGDVVVEFSDREAAEFFSIGQDDLALDVTNGTSCKLTSKDPRSYLSPLGTKGQARGVQLEEVLNCMIEGKIIQEHRVEDPPGRLNGTCDFSGGTPGTSFQWDPWCFIGGLGCFADGRNPECSFCGTPPYPDCATSTTQPSTTTEATTTTAIRTSTALVDMTIKSAQGMCLAASSGVDTIGDVEMAPCNHGNLSHQWVWNEDKGFIKNLLCLHNNVSTSDLHLEECSPENVYQNFTYDKTTGQIKNASGLCLEAPSGVDAVSGVVMAACVAHAHNQIWSIGSWVSPWTTVPPTTTTPSTTAPLEFGHVTLQATTAVATTPASRTTPSVTATPTTTAPSSTTGTTSTTTTIAVAAVTTSTAWLLSGHIQNQGDLSTCLESPEQFDGGVVQTQACGRQNRDEIWQFEPSGWLEGQGLIRNELNRCLDTPDSQWGGRTVHLWWCHGNVNQLWSYDAALAQIKQLNGWCLAGRERDEPGEDVQGDGRF